MRDENCGRRSSRASAAPPSPAVRIAEAAKAVVALTVQMAQEGRPLMPRVLPEGVAPEAWAHYPSDDAIDPVSGARWYYHIHAPGERAPEEHGHFHLFLPKAAFRSVRPMARPPADGVARAGVVHIAGLAVDRSGLPISLFTTNRWVTDEWLYPAPAIMARLERYRMVAAPGDALVNRWLEAAVGALRPEIGDLLSARDARLAAFSAAAASVYEDRALEIASEQPVDLDAIAARAS